MQWLQKLFGMSEPSRDIDPAEAKRKHASGALLIDVREKDEWKAGHVPGSRHIPLGQLAQQLTKMPRDREILFICRSGRRSGGATKRAIEAGLTNVWNVRGGIIEWRRQGLTIES